MTIYIGLLRGINVGGNQKVKMAELKAMMENMALGRPQTYIQSGNVLFESDEAEETVRERLEKTFGATFGFLVTFVLRTADHWNKLIADCPFTADELPAGHSVQASLLTQPPTEQQLAVLTAGNDGVDDFAVNGREIYFLFRRSILDSTLGKQFQKLGNVATTRNWNTIRKLAALADAMEASAAE